MRSYTLIAPAKINLYLEILGDRPDGYHELAMVMQNISLADRIDLRSLSVDKIQLHCQHPQVPKDATNLAYRAAELMVQQFPNAFSQYGGVEITIDKQIPIAAGLAGGSTNAAAVLVGIDLLWNLGLTQIELQELGAKLGSDVPFCLAGGTAIATGRGEQISPLPDLDNLYVVLGKHRKLAISTAWAYSTYRQQFGSTYVSDSTTLSSRAARVHSGPLVNAIAHQDGVKIGQLLHNDLEKVVLPAYPQVLELREAFQTSGALGTMMSGSGPTVFALAASNQQAQQIQERVKATISHPDLEIWIAKFCPTAIQVTER
ncbi:MAG: 4-(cytidine 5'-diphospho)-2-C-methyl-D-erythritol kinase [Cyanosarcina radialis HA8281-LM2]|jgi:4-diphosphocytidyl-2-C-methyl-D-erythritol kinase|nr:4-(cytidine 5'-diphospho)-2-C-methyl-D-erythritol kinase [Cyanosarcina radialis HA8281-LM2]